MRIPRIEKLLLGELRLILRPLQITICGAGSLLAALDRQLSACQVLDRRLRNSY